MRCLFVAALLVLAACAGARRPPAVRPIISSASVVTRPELSRAEPATLLEALRRTRPALLNERGGTIAVVIGARIVGGLEILQQLQAADVETVERVPLEQAALLYGPEVRGPVLLVTLRTR